MSFKDAICSVFSKLLVFDGRACRSEYWFFQLFLTLILFLAFIGMGFLIPPENVTGMVYLPLIFGAMAQLTVTVRRFHDCGVSGWWALVYFVPLGGLVFLYFVLKKGTEGENKYGPDPLPYTFLNINDESIRCFNDLKRIWEGFSDDRIIPFCTPVISRPTAVIVAQNHSVFTRGCTPEEDSIAERLSERLTDKNVFLREDYAPNALSVFADAMLEILDLANIEVDRNWMGTNRCPIQKKKLDEIRYLPSFEERQKETDDRLRALFKAIAPEKILLVGKYAATLYYPNAESSSRPFYDLHPKTEQLAEGIDTTIIAIPYPNYKNNKDSAVERLERFWS